MQQLERKGGNLRGPLSEIGEELIDSTRHRFSTATDPEGNKWPLNSIFSTLLNEKKPGDKPLLGETGNLSKLINAQLVGNNALEVGSILEYAAIQQFGGTKQEFPHLWGDIPARPFLGISNEDERTILEIIEDHLLDDFS